MSAPKPDKIAAWRAAMTAHVLETGLTHASLRPLARAAGTSDRMLIYHFKTKDAVIAAILTDLAAQFTTLLDAALPSARFPDAHSCLTALVTALRSDAAAPYSKVWLEIIAAAAEGEGPHRATAKQILDGFAFWLEAHLPQDAENAPRLASAMLTVLEGILVMDAADQSARADLTIAVLFPPSAG